MFDRNEPDCSQLHPAFQAIRSLRSPDHMPFLFRFDTVDRFRHSFSQLYDSIGVGVRGHGNFRTVVLDNGERAGLVV